MGTSAPWKPLLLNSLNSNSHLKHSIYFQLATVGPNGKPSNRTVVFRGFAENSDKIQINTDSRTRKIEDIKYCPFAEICWYFTDSWEQYRINGKIDVIDAANPNPDKLQQRERAWFDISMKSRLQYLGLSPGLPSLNDQSSQEPSLEPSAGPVDSFCLLVLDPEQVQFKKRKKKKKKVDFLNLKSNRRLAFASRCSSSSNGEKIWTSIEIKP